MIIKESSDIVKNVLGIQEYRDFHEYSKSPYLVEVESDSKTIIENVLTGEIIVEETNDWIDPSSEAYKIYVNGWYYIRDDLSMETIISLIRNLGVTKKVDKSEFINAYTIFTTLTCNAKCPYCYEADYSKMPMSDEIAKKTAEFIVKNRKDKTVYLGWFGGEPLVNSKVIDIITDYLVDRNIPYSSSMISNGYLFNKYTRETIIDKWKLQNVQITLDGLSETYNSVKGLGNGAFEQVIRNIEYLNDLDIKVNIRMNLSNTNGSELMALVDYLAERFKGRKNIFAYVHPLADDDDNKATKTTFDTMIEIQRRILDCELAGDINLNRRSVTHCMADNDHHICVTPLGKFTPCEHYTESEFIGNLDDGVQFNACKESWKELIPASDKCLQCWRYPKCLRLKKCPGSCDCDHGMDLYWLFQEKHAIMKKYERYLTNGDKDSSPIKIQRKKVVDLAKAEVGKTITDRNYWKDIFGDRPLRGWCMAFIYDMFMAAYSKDLTDKALYTTGRRWQPEAHHRLFNTLNLIYDTPEEGDIAFYNVNGWIDHAELVVSVSSDSKSYDSVGGNIVIDGIPRVAYRKHISVDNQQLVGFGRPKYLE